ncbi:MAG: non-canonical purine NTP diphosphatase [Bacteroidales bacterium]|jgi:XTP/dITP diphosphohydrolase|nr:non-canonical purine NTP diphosphatase [Bacteroidales bacterium]MDD3166039.1 non-canonical purine NTP diphosphatase [Bacteroidales bacterium]MDD4770808.1 non-canonical purine NTP diphosphatase [Bacteroidales bacterium]
MNKKELVFASNNAHKLGEIQQLLGDRFVIKSLRDLGCTEDIPENEATLEGNAQAKARFVHEKYGCDCFADDTGLLVESLDGAPGVYSARYAGPECNSVRNIEKLLKELEGKSNRKAAFKTVIALIQGEEVYFFEGSVKGSIASACLGNDGFGYDPVFIPEGSDLSFAEMSLSEKNKISHRARAVRALVDYLNTD